MSFHRGAAMVSRAPLCAPPAGPGHHHTGVAMQIDHSIGFGHLGRDGRVGATRQDNLGGMCDRGHDAKTHGDWHLEQPSPGTFIWTSPTGRTYRRRARPLLPRPPDDDDG